MLKQILVVAGGLLLAVSLPLVALAITTDSTPLLDDAIEIASDDATQPMLQQRLRVHAATGPHEEFEPVRQRLHQPEERATVQQNMRRQQLSEMPDPGQTHGKNSTGPGGSAAEKPRGNPDAPNSCANDECPNNVEPTGGARCGSGGTGGLGQSGGAGAQGGSGGPGTQGPGGRGNG